LEKKSSSEIIRDHIKNQLEKGYDYTEKYNRKIDRKAITESLGLDKKKGYDIYNHQFKKILKQLRKDPSNYLETRFRRPKFSDLKATIKAEPQRLEPPPDPVETIKHEIRNEQQEAAQLKEAKLTELQTQVKNEHIEPTAVEAAFEGLWTIPKLWWPLESLTKEEKEALGRMWLPFFRKYLSEHLAYIGLPLLATIGIFGKHIKEARDKKKKREAKEKQDKEQTGKNHSKSESSNQ